MVIKKVNLDIVIGVTSAIPDTEYPEVAFAGNACLLTISDSFVSPEITTAEQRQKSFTDMMKVALGAEY